LGLKGFLNSHALFYKLRNEIPGHLKALRSKNCAVHTVVSFGLSISLFLKETIKIYLPLGRTA
jgi:hypothetical protein